MGKLRSNLNKPISDLLLRWRYGPHVLALFYLFGGVYLNYVFVYALVSGKIRRRGWEWVEARESIPSGYWIYVVGFGCAAIFADLCFCWLLYNAFRKPADPAAAQAPSAAQLIAKNDRH
jgi:hypothetical protein